MIRLVKTAFWIFIGVAAAFEGEKWLGKLGARLRPSSMTGSFLDTVNRRLESQR
ncbi:MAG TPA: hypothetical protein VFK89_09105 [Actinomycetota bacterium]|nr:hypothetical protein [Actinomycetota bacterium]